MLIIYLFFGKEKFVNEAIYIYENLSRVNGIKINQFKDEIAKII